jgi:hypothetical protein
MNCDHCNHIRKIQRDILNEHGNDRYPGLYVAKDKDPDAMSLAVSQADYSLPAALQASVAACRCDCHALARLVGKLPKLVVA